MKEISKGLNVKVGPATFDDGPYALGFGKSLISL